MDIRLPFKQLFPFRSTQCVFRSQPGAHPLLTLPRSAQNQPHYDTIFRVPFSTTNTSVQNISTLKIPRTPKYFHPLKTPQTLPKVSSTPCTFAPRHINCVFSVRSHGTVVAHVFPLVRDLVETSSSAEQPRYKPTQPTHSQSN